MGERYCPVCSKLLLHKSKSLNDLINILKKSIERRCLSCRSKNRKLSEEAKKKISESKKTLSDETKLKFSKLHKGKVVSAETKNKISNTLKGRKLSIETKNKMSLARKGKKFKK